MDAALLSSKDMTWQTPENVLDLVRLLAPIGLDPCTVASNPTGAQAIATFELGVDGLQTGWTGYGLVFCNPPYGRALGAWVDKCRREGLAGAEIVLLVPARPDTKWFQGIAPVATSEDPNRRAASVLFWRGRLRFKGAKDAAPFPSALFYGGPRHECFREVFAGRGLFL